MGGMGGASLTDTYIITHTYRTYFGMSRTAHGLLSQEREVKEKGKRNS